MYLSVPWCFFSIFLLKRERAVLMFLHFKRVDRRIEFALYNYYICFHCLNSLTFYFHTFIAYFFLQQVTIPVIFKVHANKLNANATWNGRKSTGKKIPDQKHRCPNIFHLTAYVVSLWAYEVWNCVVHTNKNTIFFRANGKIPKHPFAL